MKLHAIHKLSRRLERGGCTVSRGTSVSSGGKFTITAPDGAQTYLSPRHGSDTNPAELERWARKHGAQI